MIVDTSALLAILLDEPGSRQLKRAILQGGAIPAPALVEFQRVVTRRGSQPGRRADALLQDLFRNGDLRVEPFTAQDADLAGEANARFGAGNGRGGTLNLLDLMVYAAAKRTGGPILCTGKDFAATDAEIHPASRIG